MDDSKVIPLSKRRETAADYHWNKIDEYARFVVQLSTDLNTRLARGKAPQRALRRSWRTATPGTSTQVAHPT